MEKEDITKSGWNVEWQRLDNGDLLWTIPDEIVTQLQLRDGQKAYVWVANETIFIKPKPRLSQIIGRWFKSASGLISRDFRT